MHKAAGVDQLDEFIRRGGGVVAGAGGVGSFDSLDTVRRGLKSSDEFAGGRALLVGNSRCYPAEDGALSRLTTDKAGLASDTGNSAPTASRTG